ncbi:MAG: hypothetical protein AAGE52_41800 [Myxococcota bacterium]
MNDARDDSELTPEEREFLELLAEMVISLAVREREEECQDAA